jgi:hypothetical protein
MLGAGLRCGPYNHGSRKDGRREYSGYFYLVDVFVLQLSGVWEIERKCSESKFVSVTETKILIWIGSCSILITLEAYYNLAKS